MVPFLRNGESMAINIKDLTNAEVEGRGTYDELMRAVSAHMENEFNQGRISHGEYAQVYLGAIQTVLNTATQFTLQAPIQSLQEQILGEQLLQAKQQTELITLQKEGQDLANQTAEYNLTNMMPEQLATMIAQKTLVQEQVNTQTAQTKVVELQDDQLQAQISLTGKQEDLVDEQITAANFQYAETVNGVQAEGTIKRTWDKADRETAILTQKLETEKAQTEGTKDSLGGLVGAEITLKDNQAETFLRDAEQKAAKFFTDTAGLYKNVDPGFDITSWGLTATNSEETLKKVIEGIGGTYTPHTG